MADGDYERRQAREEELRRFRRILARMKDCESNGRRPPEDERVPRPVRRPDHA